ncbi:MAG: M3 family metallopeptidase [Oligoflexia bacterium]
MQNNPLLSPWTGRFGEIPFDQIKVEHYRPAFDAALAEARQNLAALRSDASKPTFENTIERLESLTEKLDRCSGVFFNMVGAEAGESMHALAREISPLTAAFSNDLLLDAKVFARVKEVFDLRAGLKLTPEQSMLLEKTYKSFVRNGALLDLTAKERLREIDAELAKLGPQYSENVLKATYAREFWINSEADLEGIPESARLAAREAAKEKGRPGEWLFTLEAPSYIPVLSYAKKRQLREEMWRAYGSKALLGEFDNRTILKRIAVLRHQRAGLLGYSTHAHYVLEERMAQSPKNVKAFLDKLFVYARPAAERELEDLKRLARDLEGISDFKPWDAAYFMEKLKHARFDFDEEELRPYFPLEQVVAGVFEHARRLYGLEFRPVSDVAVYHPDVKVYQVIDTRDERFIGLFYTDFFPRKTKKGGAWMTSFRDQGLMAQKIERPHVSIVCNFTPPAGGKPSLLTYDEVRTLFHEFGHALHGLLSDCTYRSVGGTNVYWDFVELPSQVMENWTEQKESLDLFARHHDTGQVMPAELAKKIREASRFMAGWYCLRQLQFAELDMAWHASDPSSVNDVEAFEEKVLERTRILPRVAGTATSPAFSHIFDGGYSAGYYSYKWAEVLDADAFEYFQEHGLFDREIAAKFRREILSKGGSEHPSELYRRFRGRDPDPEALIRRDFGPRAVGEEADAQP